MMGKGPQPPHDLSPPPQGTAQAPAQREVVAPQGRMLRAGAAKGSRARHWAPSTHAARQRCLRSQVALAELLA